MLKSLERLGFIPKDTSEEVNVKRKPGRKSSFDKCREAYLNGQIQNNMLK